MYRSLIFLLYRSLLTLGFPFLILYILWRGFKDRRYWTGLRERFGGLSFRSKVPGGIWLHAVSVGEVVSAGGLIRALKSKFPGLPIFVSCSTLAGRELADQRLRDVASGIFYAPFDYAWMVRRVLRRLRPSCVVVLETEIWPNLWREAKQFGATLYVVNGRISDAALPNYRAFRWFFAPVLTLPLQILAQSDQDAERFRELGAVQATVNGNLKYDFHPPSAPLEEIRRWAGGHPLFIAASTMPPDEEDAVIAAYKQLFGTRMILAPRKPDRFGDVAAKLKAAGIKYVRRSELDGDADAPVLLLDSLGELASLFALPSVVFVGGSLVTWGGHNILEPAFFGRPIITGPHMQNFAAMFNDFQTAGALRVVRDSIELAAAVRELLCNPGDLGERAWRLAESKRGATAKAVEAIRLGAPLTHRPCRWFWAALSKLWLTGVKIDRATTKHRLTKPVVSVGGLAMGGSGKTPFALWLASQLHQRGIRVGILTRGYRRQDRQPAAFAPGETAPVDLTGDEAQLFLRAGTAWVGIGADRYLTGRLLEKRVDLFLLDDGFQHWALERDLDIVLIDPLDPYAGGGVFPAGLLREDFSALQRADFVVRPRKVVENPPPPGRYSAFCGIGNPASFRLTLEQLGIEIDHWREFPDHHRYEASDFDGLVPPLLTTEKDAMNLPPDAPPVIVIRIGLEVPDGNAIVERICSLLPNR